MWPNDQFSCCWRLEFVNILFLSIRPGLYVNREKKIWVGTRKSSAGFPSVKSLITTAAAKGKALQHCNWARHSGAQLSQSVHRVSVPEWRVSIQQASSSAKQQVGPGTASFAVFLAGKLAWSLLQLLKSFKASSLYSAAWWLLLSYFTFVRRQPLTTDWGGLLT